MTHILIVTAIFTIAAIISPWLAVLVSLWIIWKLRKEYR